MTAAPVPALSPPTRSGRLRLLPVLLGLLLVVLALGVRLWGLTERGIWLDETVSLRVAAQPLAEIARGEVFDNHTPPFYYLLLHLWFRLVPEGLGTLRLLSVLTDLACLVVLTTAVRRALGAAVALGVGAAYAVAPFAVRLAQEGRMYPLLMLLVVGCFALALEADRRRDRAWPAVALVPVAAAALYTHYYAALSLLAIHAVMGWRLRHDRPARRRWWGAMGAAFLLFVPWLPVVAELLAGGGQFFRAFGLAVVPYAFLRFVVGFSWLPTHVGGKLDLAKAVLDHLPLLAAVALGVGTVLLLAVRRLLRRQGEPGAGPPAGPVVGPLLLALVAVPPLLALAVTLVSPSLDERYLAVCFPFFLVLAVVGTAEALGPGGALRRRTGPRGPEVWRWAAVSLTAALFLAGAGMQLADPDAGTTPWREAAEELVARQPAGGRVLVRPAYYAPVLAANLARISDAASAAPADLPASAALPAGRRPRRTRVARFGRTARGGGATWTVAGTGPGPPTPLAGADRTPGAVWWVEVAFLVRDQPPVPDPRWRREEHRLLPAGNGLRLLRLRPTREIPAGTPGAAPETVAEPPVGGPRGRTEPPEGRLP